ncbi:MAG: diguanylate cyclase [Mycobacterium sp.]|nr:diguanylate cyclase [Mycobacterium sp.]
MSQVLYACIGVIALVFMATLAASLLSRTSVERSVSTLKDQLIEIKTTSSNLTRAYNDQETFQRAFMLTGDPLMIGQYEAAVVTSARLESELYSEIASSQHAAELLPLLQDEITAAAVWRNRGADPQLAARRAGPVPSALLEQMDTESKRLFGELRQRYRTLAYRIDSLVTDQLENIRGALRTDGISQMVAAGIFLFSILAILFTVRRMLTRPASRLARAVRAVADGDYNQRLDRTGPREIAEISAAVEAMRDKLEHQARFDPVTGLPNNADTMGALESALESHSSQGAHLGVLFCDVDHFKQVNDTWGHAIGDEVLAAIAARIGECVGPLDVVGRIGGDEMLIVLPGRQCAADVTAVAERIRRRVAEPMVHDGFTVHATVSIGVTVSVPGDSAESIKARADRAMYQAKQAGRNTVAEIDSPSRAIEV